MAQGEAVTTVEMDDQGRLYIPKPVRHRLGINGQEALLELGIDVIGGDGE